MHPINLRHKFNLRCRKIATTVVVWAIAIGAFAQESVTINNPNYDDRKIVTYGFSIGLHSSAFQLNHSETFVSSSLDTLHSINPPSSPGFSLGFIVNIRATDLLDLRLLPRVSFYEYDLTYQFTNGNTEMQIAEPTMVELPFMIKYKSVRRGNFRMYVTGGVVPGFDASGKNDLEDPTLALGLKDNNLSIELGVGLDIYYPLFKFSPEIRYSRGVVDVLGANSNSFSEGISRLNTHNFHLFLLFQ